ncbi:MAG: response regulator [Polyangiaceae bacterium]
MKTILLVDDEYALVESLTELLQDEGYRVVSAANGEDGLEKLRKEKADLVVSDIMMPIGGGSEFVRRLRALPEFRLTPVVITSAASKESLDGSTLQVSAFLIKPFYFEKLLAIIVRLIGSGEQNG